ncbi:XRE family transcriptional regulator [Alkaliphilus serpentinus]|uniref:LexA family transcriptional regulator n=1 Tax=Alkaliphilus serpentinus TaxID=1482731 RepID=A0A833HR84_9FIRM|nr:XRE family transcriptional regulator [Alkaliphilus serpentinus]KAB3532833.1 LexA family transcriptional regulator [Alkaliphilus serpentinus]
MNRLAAIIKEARLKAKLTEKQLAKKCGLSEAYIIQIESGKKVINEKAAENILNKLGKKLESVYDQIEAKETPVKAKEIKEEKKEAYTPIEPTHQWADALANIIKKFPIYDIANNKVVGFKDLPVIDKKIEGFHWEKLMFLQVDNDEMEALRIKRNDIITISLTKEIHNGSVYLIEVNKKRILRQLRREQNNRVVLSTGVKGENPVITDLNKVEVIGKCVKVEFRF